MYDPGKKKELFTMEQAIKEAYTYGEDEESMGPICLVDRNKKPKGRIKKGDYVIFYDIRGEREIELTQAFTQPDFDSFTIYPDLKTKWVTMIEYHPGLNVKVAFPPLGEIKDTLSEVISKAGLKQVKISESEKGVHITYFLNGKKGNPFAGEDRVIIPSPNNVSNYDECPQMSCAEVTEEVIKSIKEGKNHFICANLANIDVVGHTENRTSIIKAVEIVDYHVGRIVMEARVNGLFTLLVADHGTVEKWYYPDGKIDTGHTNSSVPFILIPPVDEERIELKGGEVSLIDVAPTILQLLGLQPPGVMTGKSLIKSSIHKQSRRKILLLIMDGWGYNPSHQGNLIAVAKTKEVDSIMGKYPWVPLSASGEAVGLPAGTVGNSESGHLHLGAGRVIPSDRMRIANAIKEGEFQKNREFLWGIRGAKREGTDLHLLGIVSFFSSHGSIDYLYALMEMAKKEGMRRVFIHCLLGRRGERPESGAYYVSQIEKKALDLGLGKVASVIGRYWALDREENWDRIEKTYRLLVEGKGRHVMDMSV